MVMVMVMVKKCVMSMNNCVLFFNLLVMFEEFFVNDMEVLYIVRVIVLFFDLLLFFGVFFWCKF